MATEKLLADLLQEHRAARKTGALYISVQETSENLVRFYFKEGELYHLSYGPVKDRELLDILDCYNFGKTVYFEGLTAPSPASDFPRTDVIIAKLIKSGKRVLVE